MTVRGFLWCAMLTVALTAAGSRAEDEAEDKSGVSPNTISRPTGPGSLEGLGDAFQPAPNTGTAKYAEKYGASAPSA